VYHQQEIDFAKRREALIMTNFLMILVLILMIMVGFLFYSYFRSQAKLSDAFNLFLSKEKPPVDRIRNEVVVRKERSAVHDKLMLLEAALVINERLDLTEEEIALVEKSREDIKRCTEDLEKAKEWLGNPFDLTWSEILERLPKVDLLYRKKIITDNAQSNSDINANPPPSTN